MTRTLYVFTTASDSLRIVCELTRHEFGKFVPKIGQVSTELYTLLRALFLTILVILVFYWSLLIFVLRHLLILGNNLTLNTGVPLVIADVDFEF